MVIQPEILLILAQIYLLIATLFLAGKDASSYLLKDKLQSGELTSKRINRWHRDGVILNTLFILPLILLVGPLIALYALLIRLSVFDIAFNYWSGLNPNFLGSTSRVDQLFAKIFGQQGAIKKSLIFLLILVILNIVL